MKYNEAVQFGTYAKGDEELHFKAWMDQLLDNPGSWGELATATTSGRAQGLARRFRAAATRELESTVEVTTSRIDDEFIVYARVTDL